MTPGRAYLRTCVASVAALALPLALAGCGGDGGTGGTSGPATTPTPAATSVPATTTTIDRPPAATPAELSARTSRLPGPSGSRPAEQKELVEAYERGEDWTGRLIGRLFLTVATGEWRVCWSILESYPEQCGDSVVLAAEPIAYTETPTWFDTQNGVGSDEPAVVVSTADVAIRGTFFHDSALFVEAP